jgi:NADPH:quinone reductase-like Zn-dependent oxidoreductase
VRAFYARSYGGPEVMSAGDLPDPVPGRGEVLVAVKAASVNPVDWKVRNGEMRILSGSKFPKVLGCDYAGVVQWVGPGVLGLRTGERVYGVTLVALRRPGSHAQLLVAPAKRVRHLPDAIPFETAAALPVAALTAVTGLGTCGDLTGRAVLVNGATGGVGHFAVQIARARGADVTAVCSARNADLARMLGASKVLDYATEHVGGAGRTYDVIFDAHGGIGASRAARALAPKGVYLTSVAGVGLALAAPLLALRGKRAAPANVRDRVDDYAALEALVLGGGVKPVVEEVFRLERAAEAFAVAEAGRVRGKVVIRID